jgi:hypothetical protein
MSTRPPAADAAAALPTLRECKVRASLLLKALRSADPARAAAAAQRLRALRSFSRLTPERIVAWRDDVRRKHALAVIAAELGYPSWVALRAACDVRGAAPVPRVERLFDGPSDVFLNHWCKSYEEASRVREDTNGFLFPYRLHYVVCTAQLLASRGVDPHDPDWARIGRDWVRPRDPLAFARLARRLADAGLAA